MASASASLRLGGLGRAAAGAAVIAFATPISRPAVHESAAGSWEQNSAVAASWFARFAERPDGPDRLIVREVPRPEPREGWALVRVEAFGLNLSEYKTLRGFAGDAVTFPRILGIELVGVVEAVCGDAPPVPPGTKVAALMGDLGRAFDGGYAEYALVPDYQLIALDTTLPWDVLGALPETFVCVRAALTLEARGASCTLAPAVRRRGAPPAPERGFRRR